MDAVRPNTETRPGRMLDALLRSENESGKLVLTVAVADAAGGSRMHETFQLRKWESRDGSKHRLYVSIPSTADWDAGARPLSPLVLDLDTGELKAETRDPRMTPMLAYAARAAWRYATTGEVPTPQNGSITIQEESICGACGLPLRDDTSIELGYGPDCEKRLFGTRRSRSKTMKKGVAA